MKTVNQAHHVGSNNKDLRKIVFKRRGATITLFENIDYVNASIRVETLKKLYSDWRGQFIIIR